MRHLPQRNFSLRFVSALMFAASACQGQAANETAFVALIPEGGAVWPTSAQTHLAVHPSRNRLYTVAEGPHGTELIHRDAVTGSLIGSSTTSIESTWEPLDMDVWGAGDEVVVAWGERLGSSERVTGTARERFDVHTGASSGLDRNVKFLAFQIDQQNGIAWGAASNVEEPHYYVTSLELSTGSVASATIDLSTAEAIVRDVVLDASENVFYALFQPTLDSDPFRVKPQGFVLAYSLPEAAFLGRVDIIPAEGGAENYRMGGMALDAERDLLYTIPSDRGAIRKIDVSNPASMVVSATFEESEISAGYTVGGAAAVDPQTGYLFVANDSEMEIMERVVLLDPAIPTVVGTWSSGADPAGLIYDPRLSQLYVTSFEAQTITAIDSTREKNIYHVPIAILPRDLVFDETRRRLFLLSEGGNLFVVDSTTNVLTDKVDDVGLRPFVGIQPDSQRNRLLIGTFGEAPPAVFDTGTMSRLGELPFEGSALAVASRAGYLLQTGSRFTDAAALRVSEATSASLLKEIPPAYTFAKTIEVALDEDRHILYGISGNRKGGLGYGIWAFDWVDETTSELFIPPGSWDFSRIEVDRAAGRIAVLGYSGAARLLLYDSRDDDDPGVVDLPGLTVNDLCMDETRRLVVLLGFETLSGEPFLASASLNGAGVPEFLWLEEVPFPPERMALDDAGGFLWLAASRPSGLYRVSWPPGGAAGKRAGQNREIDVSVASLPGRVLLNWSIEPAPDQGTDIDILRQDGALAAFRPLLPASLPHWATEYVDVDVIPGTSYVYRVRVIDASETAQQDTGPFSIPPPDPATVLVYPRSWVASLPTGGSNTISLFIRGAKASNTEARFLPYGTGAEDYRGLTWKAHPATITIPGGAEVIISASDTVSPGRCALPLLLTSKSTREVVWLFVDVFVPFREDNRRPIVYPYGRSAITVSTDSRLREQEGNILVVKGEIERDGYDLGGTSVFAAIDAGDGSPPLGRAGVVTSHGLYSVGLPVPVLARTTSLKARVTWMGSSTSPGGISALLYLPIGGYSGAGPSKVSQAGPPERMLLARGKIPDDVPEAVADALIRQASGTLLLEDFCDETAQVIQEKGALLGACSETAGSNVLLTYLLGECSNGYFEFSSGDTLAPSEFAQSLPEDAVNIVIVEGLHSGCFQGRDYPAGTTVLTSSRTDDDRNQLDTDGSYSQVLFRGLSVPHSVSFSHDLATVFFSGGSPLFPSFSQNPQITAGTAADWNLAHRFAPGRLEDSIPPRIIAIPASEPHLAGRLFPVSVGVTDNRPLSEVTVEARAISLDGRILSQRVLKASEVEAGVHEGTIETTPAPGFFLSLFARDGSDNASEPVSIWIPTVATAEYFDMDGSGEVDEHDLLGWCASPHLHYDYWVFEFARFWGKQVDDERLQ